MNSSYTTMDAIGDIFVIYGIVIVVSMLVAVVIRGIVWALSQQTTAPAPVVKPAAAPQPAIIGIPQEHLAVITAAVAAMFSTHRIVRIEAATRGYSWTTEARSAHHASHAPRASR